MFELSYSKSKLVGSLSMFQKQVRLTVALEMVQPETEQPATEPRTVATTERKAIQRKRQRKMFTGLTSAGGQMDLFTTHDEV